MNLPTVQRRIIPTFIAVMLALLLSSCITVNAGMPETIRKEQQTNSAMVESIDTANRAQVQQRIRDIAEFWQKMNSFLKPEKTEQKTHLWWVSRSELESAIQTKAAAMQHLIQLMDEGKSTKELEVRFIVNSQTNALTALQNIAGK